MTGPSPSSPQQSGTAHPLEVIYNALCCERLWASHYDIPEERPMATVDETFGVSAESVTYEDEQTPPESEMSAFAAAEDPEPLSHMGTEEADG
jgi:hypothetical protein